MNAQQNCTLILILHNRHSNMDRLTDYYCNESYRIIIADSSKNSFNKKLPDNFEHIYTPDFSFTQKIEHVLAFVRTPYVVMCADDDFIIPSAINECVEFLDTHPDYSVAQGRCIKYLRSSVIEGKPQFGILYKKQISIESEDVLSRLNNMFSDYRSLLYAVHRTEVLQKAFNQTGRIVSNLYLNEYLTAAVPVVAGKTKELDVLYQVREYAEDSDDKTTDNLDTIVTSNLYQKEYHVFLDIQVDNALGYSTRKREELYSAFEKGFQTLADQLALNRNRKISFKKKIGNLINKLPIIGPVLISVNRKAENKKDMNVIIRNEKDAIELGRIKNILLNHR